MISRYEREHPLFKEAYERLGLKTISSCKFNEKLIKQKLYDSSYISQNAIIEKLEQKFKVGDKISAKEAKLELQKIYDELNIKSRAKATDINNYIPARTWS